MNLFKTKLLVAVLVATPLLLAANIVQASGGYISWVTDVPTPTIVGTDGADDIRVVYDLAKDRIKGFLNTETEPVFSLSVSTCDTYAVTIEGHGGDDTIDVDLSATNCSCDVSGGDGDDTMTIVNCDGGVVDGGEGDDRIVTGPSSETYVPYIAPEYIYGGPGNDVFIFSVGYGYADTSHYRLESVVIGGSGRDNYLTGAFDVYMTIVCDASDRIGADTTALNWYYSLDGGCSAGYSTPTEWEQPCPCEQAWNPLADSVGTGVSLTD